MSTRVRRYRLERGWSQETLARRAGLSPRTISAVEQGKPCLQTTKRKLCRALVVPWEHRERLWP